MATLIKNASPQNVPLGTNDLSGRVVTPGPLEIPQHLIKSFFFARKGTTKPMITSGGSMLLNYGSETFDINDKYYNHSTRFMLGAAAHGSVMAQRVVPDDAGVNSNIVVYLDIVSDDVPNYVRTSTGEYVLDANGDPVVDSTNTTIRGYKVNLVSEVMTAPNYVFGTATSTTGSLTGTNEDGVSINSTRYPILELKAKYKGEYYNNIGVSIEKLLNEDIDDRIIDANKALPFRLSLFERPDSDSTPVRIKSLYGEPSVMFSFKEKAINPLTGARYDLEAVFDNNWYNETNPLLPLKYNDYEAIKLYRDNLELVTGLVMATESQYITDVDQTWSDGLTANTASWFDFTKTDTELLNDPEELYLLDIFNGKSSKNINYFTVIMDNNVNLPASLKLVTFSANTPIFLGGGSDGTLSNDMFETLVVREMQKYLDPDSEVMDMAINVESVMYDSGYTLETKKELCNFIAVRKDTAVVMGTHDASLGESTLPLSDARAIAVALKTRLKLTPESTYFGTSVMRGILVAGAGNMPDNSTKDFIPETYSILIKSSKMMGAGNGKWKAVELFDKAPKSVITELVNIQPRFIPSGIKPTLWNDGIVWAQPYDMTQYHFPAIQTVYEDDTSVLNSWFTVAAICTLQKVADWAWRNFTGSVDLTKAEFAQAVVDFVNLNIKDRFADMFVIIPEVVFTNADDQRGYSYNLVISIYANNMKTVQVTTIEARRMTDLTGE